MKKNITAIAIVLFLASTSISFARGNGQGNRGGYSHGYHNKRNHHGNHGGGYRNYGYHNRSRYYGYRGGGHYNDNLGIAVGVVGGLLLGSALMYSAPPPRTIFYGTQYTTYPPQVVVQQPRICVEDRIVTGEWQISKNDGRQVWVVFPYPVTRRVQVQCY